MLVTCLQRTLQQKDFKTNQNSIMLGWTVRCVLFIISITSLCNAQENNKKDKNMAVNEVIQKIYNLTSEALLTGTADKKEEIFKSIKTKLLKSSEAWGTKATKLVNLIMKGIQIMAANNTPSTFKDNEILDVEHNLRTGNKSEPIEDTSNDLVKKMASKIFKLAQKHFRRAKTDEDKQKIIENIKQRVMETAKEKHDLLHIKHNEIKTYTDLITRGMEIMMNKITQKKRRMIMEFWTKIPVNQENIEREYKQLEQRSNFLENPDVPTEVPNNPSLTTAFSCEEVLKQTCTDIKYLIEFVCSDNGVTLPLDKLCDGVTDCSDGSDERNCINEATKRSHRASEIMSRVEIYLIKKCFLTEDNSLLIKQSEILYDVLQRQIGFINKYKDMDLNDNAFGDVYAFKQTLNEVVVVIKTLSIGLETSLCNRYLQKTKIESMARKYMPESVDGLNEFPVEPEISLKSCKCRGSFCANLTCTEVCKRICWHKYNLGKWSCQAVDDSTTVSLDMVCDGKLDCYDESDESECNSGIGPTKYEANDIFQNILKLLQAKSISKEYVVVKTKLVSLQNSIKKLQNEAMKYRVDIVNVKSARDLCYALLSSIYEDMIEKAPEVNLENTHFFLLTVNEKLMKALKHSHTGNEKIITPDGCYCRNGKCALTQCTKGCTRACAVESKLTKYTCKGTVNSNNVSVAIDKICNGKANCPFEDDEADCSNEVCRKHHLVLLRHNIRDVGENQKGTSLGEALRSWKTKVTSTLKIAENNDRPTPITLRETINGVLRDLVRTYASVEETRRTHGNAFNDFYRLSQLVIGAVKSCGQ